MADYTTIASVRAVMPEGVKIDDVDATKVTEMISKVTNRVNVALSIGNVDLPVVDPDLLGDLDLLCRFTVAAMYMSSIRGGMAYDPKQLPEWKNWIKAFEAALVLMRAGTYTGTVSTEGGPESYTMDAEENADDETIQPKFTTARKF